MHVLKNYCICDIIVKGENLKRFLAHIPNKQTRKTRKFSVIIECVSDCTNLLQLLKAAETQMDKAYISQT